MIEHNKRFLNTKLDNDKLETINKNEASEMIKEIIINKERYYTEMVDFQQLVKTNFIKALTLDK